jgi:glycosyltransferase involved in cell wall biosynthesis
LVADYSVPAEKITVISPGVDVQAWSKPGLNYPKNGTLKILFVGGDLERKGGEMLLEAFRTLRAQVKIQVNLELHLVTQKKIPEEPGMHLHLGLTPNSTELIALYHQADVFCLPTKGDCLPMVLAEAGAAGLPIISTRVGGIPEIVREGKNGFLIDPEDTRGLVESMERLVCDQQLREEMGQQSHRLISTAHDTERNVNMIAEILCQVIENSPKRTKSV